MTNAEKYKSAKERSHAFKIFCNSHRKGLSWIPNCANCEFKDADDKCPFLWLELEAPAEKPLPCPFCGGTAILYATGIPYVRCSNCGTQTTAYKTPEGAVAAWNRRAK